MSRDELALENARLRESLARAEEEVRRRDDFLAVVTHELRNPLTPLSLSIELLLQDAIRDRLPPSPILVRRLASLHRQIKRLGTDLNRLLDFSRIRSGHLELTIEDVDLSQVVAEVAQEMTPQLETSRCELRLSSGGPQRGRWDGMRVRQVVWNLLSNAAKFGAGAPIEVETAGDDAEARLTVRDHGIGIPEHERERVFNRFERAGLTQPRIGFGVGLWLVRQIVDALGGRVSVDGEVGKGSKFTVVLPRDQHGRTQ